MRLKISLITAAALAAIVVPTAGAWQSNQFRSPTKNISCKANSYAGNVQCMTENDGITMYVGLHGRAMQNYDYSLNVPYLAPVLHYGYSWISYSKVFRCDMWRTGVRCRNVFSGHGFFLSRQTDRKW